MAGEGRAKGLRRPTGERGAGAGRAKGPRRPTGERGAGAGRAKGPWAGEVDPALSSMSFPALFDSPSAPDSVGCMSAQSPRPASPRTLRAVPETPARPDRPRARAVVSMRFNAKTLNLRSLECSTASPRSSHCLLTALPSFCCTLSSMWWSPRPPHLRRLRISISSSISISIFILINAHSSSRRRLSGDASLSRLLLPLSSLPPSLPLSPSVPARAHA